MIKKIAFVVYPVSDMARTRAFYEQRLGLAPGDNWEDKWVEYDIGHSTLAVSTVLEEAQPGANGGMVALEVSDVDQMLEILRENGVSILKDTFETPVCRMAVIADPDGNALILHQLL